MKGKKLYRLNLFENSIDSLNEALIKFQSAENGKINDLKFSVLHTYKFVFDAIICFDEVNLGLSDFCEDRKIIFNVINPYS